MLPQDIAQTFDLVRKSMNTHLQFNINTVFPPQGQPRPLSGRPLHGLVVHLSREQRRRRHGRRRRHRRRRRPRSRPHRLRRPRHRMRQQQGIRPDEDEGPLSSQLLLRLALPGVQSVRLVVLGLVHLVRCAAADQSGGAGHHRAGCGCGTAGQSQVSLLFHIEMDSNRSKDREKSSIGCERSWQYI